MNEKNRPKASMRIRPKAVSWGPAASIRVHRRYSDQPVMTRPISATPPSARAAPRIHGTSSSASNP
jgi:hypothetical protein